MSDKTDDMAPPSGNQADYWRKKLAPQIRRVRDALAVGVAASALADSLKKEGLGAMFIITVFHEATGASLGDLKLFSQWWSTETGVTDAASFDAWADEVFKKK